MKTLILGLLVAGITATSGAWAQARPAPAFEGEAIRSSTEGHTVLAWGMPDGEEAVRYELQHATDSSFSDARVIYEGIDRGSFVSGLRAGESWFRVRRVAPDGSAGPWSEPVMVDVNYASTAEVVQMLLLGGLVLMATVTSILIGHRRVERGPS